nr:hypothetical protein [Tanacetum cinerariifolium]
MLVKRSPTSDHYHDVVSLEKLWDRSPALGRYGVSVPALTKDHKNKIQYAYPEEGNTPYSSYMGINILEDIKRGPYFKKPPIRHVLELRSVETEFPAIVFNDSLTSNETPSFEPTVSSLNNNEIDFRISFDEFDNEDYTVVFDKNSFSYKIIYTNDLKTDSEIDNEKVNKPLFLSPEPSVSCIDDLDFFKGVENEFSAIGYNDALMSKSDFSTEPTLYPQLYLDDLKSDKGIDDNEIDMIQSLGDKQYQPEEIQELMCKLLEDVRNINEELFEYINSPSWNHPIFYDNNEEHSIQYKEYLENSSNAITPVLPTEEPEYSLSMGDKHLSTIPEKESDEVIKSSVKNLVQIPSEYEVTSDNESECDLPVCEDSSTFDVLKDHFEILSDSNNDDTSSDDDAFEDIEYVEASLPDSELISLEEENDVYQEEKDIDLEDILQIQDVILHKKLLSINRLIADIEPTPDHVLNDHTEETRSGSTTSHANNSPPEYDSFCFEIEPDQGRLTSIVMNDIFDNLTNDLFLEEVDLFLALDHSIPPEPPDVEVFFDFEPNSRELISAVMNNIDELNKDECFNLGEPFEVAFLELVKLIIVSSHRYPIQVLVVMPLDNLEFSDSDDSMLRILIASRLPVNSKTVELLTFTPPMGDSPEGMLVVAYWFLNPHCPRHQVFNPLDVHVICCLRLGDRSSILAA